MLQETSEPDMSLTNFANFNFLTFKKMLGKDAYLSLSSEW